MPNNNLQLRSFALGLVAVLAPVSIYFGLKSYIKQRQAADKAQNEPSKHTESLTGIIENHESATGKFPKEEETTNNKILTPSTRRRILILYATVTGSAKRFASDFAVKIERSLAGSAYHVRVVDAKDYDEEQLNSEDVIFFICSTWTGGVAPETAKRFVEGLKDYAYDFRVSKDHLSKVTFAIFGLGSAVYADHYATVAKEVHHYFIELGATPLSAVTRGDDQSDIEDTFNRWSAAMVGKLIKAAGVSVAIQNNNTAASLSLSTSAKGSNISSFPATTGAVIGNAKNKGRGSAFQQQQKLVKIEASLPTVKSSIKKSETAAATTATTANADTVSSGCCGGAGAGAGADTGKSDNSCCNSSHNHVAETGDDDKVDEDDEEEEEDRINNRFVEADDDNYSDDDSACAPPSDDGDDDDNDDNEAAAADEHESGGLLDMEDIGNTMSAAKKNELKASMRVGDGIEREMVTKLQRRALTKEGYRIIGSHSAVKLCRWTKNQMRGRGGCYKHTFYGITSYQCMEATPSLACANKCVFCWRHHKNPVGTEWRWKADEPAHIVEEAVELHRAMINEMKGIPGVQPERLLEAYTVKHCALSLVGEPIMYPKINEMLKELHDRDISSFLVTNAQFPERIEHLDPVTQLYVSVDASTRDSLKAIDRPLFKDFWERFIDSLQAMKAKQQRTVYRLTLVKGWNMKEAEGYVELIELGQPDFIEIKSVTYCGKSDASTLTMQNVPWHYECCQFSEAIANRLAERGKSARYSIATEHEHSCCVLLAREDKFKPDGVWHTWIDYPKFHQLVREYHDSGKTKLFTSQDYMAPTPSWALYKSEEKGFDPVESRWKRNKAGALVAIEYKSSESGCG